MTDNLLFDLFEIKQKFLREIPHPKLILRQIKHIESKSTVFNNVSLIIGNTHPKDQDIAHSLVDFLDEHIQAILVIKHQISAAPNYQELHEILVKLYFAQIHLLKKFQSYLPEKATYPDTNLKMSMPIDIYLILKWIRTKNLKENEIKNYLCILLNACEIEPELLLDGCLRANKIISNG